MSDLNMQWLIQNQQVWLDGLSWSSTEAQMIAQGIALAATDPTFGMFMVGGEFHDPIRSAGEHISPAELPPLPFPAVSIDVDHERTFSFAIGSEDKLSVDIHGFAVFEREPGVKWEVVALCVLVDRGRESTSFLVYEVTENSDVNVRGQEQNVVFENFPCLRSWVVELVHLIGAKNVEHVPDSRQVRRNLQRKMNVKHHVQSFTIRQRSTTEKSSGTGGKSNRQYSCRWIVRGHWRSYESGKRTWVAPYIKGPAGAPWRDPSKPLYVRTAS